MFYFEGNVVPCSSHGTSFHIRIELDIEVTEIGILISTTRVFTRVIRVPVRY